MANPRAANIDLSSLREKAEALQSKILIYNAARYFNGCNRNPFLGIYSRWEGFIGNHIVTNKEIFDKYKSEIKVASKAILKDDKKLIGVSYVCEADIHQKIFSESQKHLELLVIPLEKKKRSYISQVEWPNLLLRNRYVISVR